MTWSWPWSKRSIHNPKVPLSTAIADAFVGGRMVTVENSLGISAVWGAVRVISETIASMSLELFEIKSDKSVQVADAHPLHWLLHDEPSKLYNSFTFRETMQAMGCLRGNMYARIVRRAGEVKELLILHPDYVTPEYTRDGRIKYWVRDEDGMKQREYEYDDILHIPAMATDDGVMGKSPLTVARETFGLAMAVSDYGKQFFEGGAALSGVIEHPNKMTPDAQKNLRESWTNKHQGVRNAGSVAILEEGMKFHPLSISPQDAMFIESRKLQVEEIARIFRVPLHMLQSLDRATNNNIEQQSIDFISHCIRPWVKRWETELNRKLFLTPERRKKYFIRFNIDSLMRGDAASRSDYYRKLHSIGALSANDVRGLENMNAIEGGDKYFTQVNMAPLDAFPIVSKKPDKTEK